MDSVSYRVGPGPGFSPILFEESGGHFSGPFARFVVVDWLGIRLREIDENGFSRLIEEIAGFIRDRLDRDIRGAKWERLLINILVRGLL